MEDEIDLSDALVLAAVCVILILVYLLFQSKQEVQQLTVSNNQCHVELASARETGDEELIETAIRQDFRHLLDFNAQQRIDALPTN